MASAGLQLHQRHLTHLHLIKGLDTPAAAAAGCANAAAAADMASAGLRQHQRHLTHLQLIKGVDAAAAGSQIQQQQQQQQQQQ
jgi:hypothetical protein